MSWSATISAAVWIHSNCFAPLFYSFSIFPGQTLAISRALRLGVSIHSTPHPFRHSCCWWPPPSGSPASSPPIPLPSDSDCIPSSSLPQPQLGVSSSQTHPSPGHWSPSFWWLCVPIHNIFEHPSPMYRVINLITCTTFNPHIQY